MIINKSIRAFDAQVERRELAFNCVSDAQARHRTALADFDHATERLEAEIDELAQIRMSLQAERSLS